MKFLHLGDLHLGKDLANFSLYDDQKYILTQLLQLAAARKVDAVILAGDLYDRAIPPERAVELLDWFLRELTLAGYPVYAISGNHDSDERLNFASSLLEESGVFMAAKYEGTLYERVVEDEYGPLHIYLLPFVKASQVKKFHPEASIETYDDAVRTVLEAAGVNPEERNLLVAHQFVAGHTDVTGSGSESFTVENVGLVDRIGVDVFDGFDYVALGHIHKAQQVGRPEVRYCGSLLKYSLTEVDYEKSVPIVTLCEHGRTEVELVPLKPMRNLRHLTGPIRELIDPKRVTDPQDFIYATLTDEEIADDAMGILQQVYPNTIRTVYDNSHTRAVTQVDITQIAGERTFTELITEFYEQMYGTAMTEEELKAMQTAAGEAGVADETH